MNSIHLEPRQSMWSMGRRRVLTESFDDMALHSVDQLETVCTAPLHLFNNLQLKLL